MVEAGLDHIGLAQKTRVKQLSDKLDIAERVTTNRVDLELNLGELQQELVVALATQLGFDLQSLLLQLHSLALRLHLLLALLSEDLANGESLHGILERFLLRSMLLAERLIGSHLVTDPMTLHIYRNNELFDDRRVMLVQLATQTSIHRSEVRLHDGFFVNEIDDAPILLQLRRIVSCHLLKDLVKVLKSQLIQIGLELTEQAVCGLSL